MENLNYIFYDYNEMKNDYNIRPIVKEYVSSIYIVDEFDIENLVDWYIGLFKNYHDFLCLAIYEMKIVGFLRYDYRSVFNHNVLLDVFFLEDYNNPFYLEEMLNKLSNKRNNDRFCLINNTEPDPIWRECGFIDTNYNKNGLFLMFKNKEMLETCKRNSLYRGSEILDNRSIGEYYYKIHKKNRNEYSFYFFSSLISICISFVILTGVLAAHFLDKIDINKGFIALIFLSMVYGFYSKYKLVLNKKNSKKVFGFSYTRLIINYERSDV